MSPCILNAESDDWSHDNEEGDGHDPEGNVVLVKLIAYVIDPIGNAMVFNYSPYAKLSELLSSAKVWIECGCPSNCDELGIPSKWTKESLSEYEWVG